MNINVKVSTMENEAESAEATGGQGGPQLISWDYNRTATLTMQDALISDTSLAMLSGNAVEDGTDGIQIDGREELTVDGGTITLKEASVTSLHVMKVTNGVIDPTESVTVDENLGGEVTLTGVDDGDTVMAFYQYILTDPNATKVTFSANAFPHTYRVVGDTIGKDQFGNLRKMQFRIPTAKLQSTFSLTMDVENVSVFDFNLNVMVDPNTNNLYEIITQ